MDKRVGLKKNTILGYKNIKYEILSEAGRGGSSIVYNARYMDSVIKDHYHYVLIKEFFPLCGDHIRRENKDIICEEEVRKVYELSKKSFINGNKIHIELIENKIEGVASYIDTFEQNNTLYSIYAYNSGCTLAELYPEKEFDFFETVFFIRALLVTVDGFHRLNILHMDISPDNIVIAKDNTGQTRVMLIDYNSIISMNDKEINSEALSIKDGYTAPEVILDNRRAIGPTADIFSISAIFYALLTGNTLDMSLVINKNVRNALMTAEGFGRNISDAVKEETISIITKGLRAMPQKRQQSIGEYLSEIDTLTALMEKKLITMPAIWEAAKRSLDGAAGNTVPKHMIMSRLTCNGNELSIDDLKRAAEQRGNIIISGAGGIGKTTLLKYIAGEAARYYTHDKTVYFYIPLKYYQENNMSYITNNVLSLIDYDIPEWEKYSAYNQLRGILDKGGNDKAGIVFLLDGFNEILCNKSLLIEEINRLAAYSNVGIILSARSESDIQAGLDNFIFMQIERLTLAEIGSYLGNFEIPCPANETILEYLKYPMMLSFYTEIYNVWFSDPEHNEIGIMVKPEDIIHKYINSLASSYVASHNGSEQMRLKLKFIVELLLPEIAEEMQCRKIYRLSRPELEKVVSRNYRLIGEKEFGRCFKEYAGKRRVILSGAEDETEWFYDAVEVVAIQGLRIIVYNNDGSYSFIHDNMRDYLAMDFNEKKKQMSRRLKIKRMFSGGRFNERREQKAVQSLL